MPSKGRLAITLVIGLMLGGCEREMTAPGPAPSVALGASSVAAMYAVDFVATAATGFDLNDAGDVTGRSYSDPGCGAFCLAPQDVVVWRNGVRTVLPLLAGYPSSYHFPRFINNAGLIAGVVGSGSGSDRAVIWTAAGSGYTLAELGNLGGMGGATVAGLDEQGRIVGWASTGGAIPTAAAPYLWSQATGMVDLHVMRFPNEIPTAMSPGGTVLTTNSWYRLGDPGSVRTLPLLPRSFVGAGVNGSAINDAGDQAHFLVSTSTQNLVYPFRLPAGGDWQQISTVGTGRLSRYGMGTINDGQDVTLTLLSTGGIAAGPTGLVQGLAPLVSPAYGGASVTTGGPMNGPGQILAQVMIGRSARLVKLTPVAPCGGNCLVGSVALTSVFVEDPANPGQCFEGGRMYNQSTATVMITDENGGPLGNAQVTGHFLDDYWTDYVVTGTTNASGVVTWSYRGPPCVGAIAFLLDRASLGTRAFDRTRGTLSAWVIPSTAPPSNTAPVASFSYTCDNVTLTCNFDGTGSSDDAGIVAFGWNFGDGTTGGGVTTSHTFAAAGSYQVTLTVTDGAGLTGSQTRKVSLSPPANQAPVARWTVSCQPAPAHVCSFDGTGSSDPDGTIVAYKWTQGGKVISTAASFTRTFSKSQTLKWTLTVTDNGGMTGKLTKTFTVP